MWTHLIWDFNGTLFDDVAACVESVNTLLRRRGLPAFLSYDDYRACFDFPVEKYYRAIGFDLDGEGFPALAHEWVTEYLTNSRSAGLRDGVAPLLHALPAHGMRQMVLSASEKGMLAGQLDTLGIGDCFETVLGLDDIYARSKVDIAASWRRENPEANPLFVGDTLHDAEVAASVGADCVLVTGGHQNRERLALAGVPVVDSFDQLLPLIEMAKTEEPS